MTHSALSRAVATATVTTFVAIAAATTASAGEVTAANLAFDVAPGVLTLPAGDGVRDATQFTISSDIATEVSFVIRNADSAEMVATLPAVTLEAATPAVVDVDLTGLDRGGFEVYATPTDGESIVTSLTVGSGEPSDVTMSLSAGTIFTWTGATPRTSVATVSATDETGLAVPFHGAVTAAIGGKAYTPAIASTTGAAATVSLPSSKFGYGTGTVVARISGPTEGSYTSDVQSLKVLQTAITSVALSTSSSSVYPYKDSYYDTAKITVTPKTTSGTVFTSTGSVKITRDGKTVKTWTLTSSKAWSATWDGKVAGKIVPGTYKITVSLKGPEGSTKTYAKNIVVKSNKLVTKTKVVSYSGQTVFKTFTPFDALGENACYYDYPHLGYIGCEAWSAAGSPDDYALISWGTVTVPTEVVNAEKYGSAKVSASLYSVKVTTGADWYLETDNGSVRSGMLTSGNDSLGAITLGTGSKKVYISLGLLDYASASVGSVKFTYTYKVLSSS